MKQTKAFRFVRTSIQTLLSALFTATIALVVFPAQGQSPNLLWATNVGATLFAVDSNTNLYANDGGKVIKLTGSGIPFQTNSICPLPGIARRDDAGNYYFAGTLQVSHMNEDFSIHFFPQDFGNGIVLSNQPVYLAKYSEAGTLLWATNFGWSGVRGAVVQDMTVDSGGNALVGYWIVSPNTQLYCDKWNSIGGRIWSKFIQEPFGSSLTGKRIGLTSVSPTESFAHVLTDGFYTTLKRLDGNGTASEITNWFSPNYWSTEMGSRPVINSLGEHYDIVLGEPFPEEPSGTYLVKRNPSGTEIKHSFIGGSGTTGVVGRDNQNGVYVATETARISHYDSDCNLVWTLDLPANCESMISDTDGNRFLSLANGIVARVASEGIAPFELVADSGTNGMSSEGFKFTIVGEPSVAYQIYVSTNLTDWEHLGAVSNATGTVQFTDTTATNSNTRYYRAGIGANE